jgi:uncharacterized protein YqhQ
VGDADYIAIIILLLIIITGLVYLVIHMYRVLSRVIFRVNEKLDDIDLEIHFATDNYLLNERKKQRDSNGKTG